MKTHELVKRLIDSAGGSLPAARAMGRPAFQGTLHKIANGQVASPKRETAERIARHFRIPVESLYDERVADQVLRERFPTTPPMGVSAPPPPAYGFPDIVSNDELELLANLRTFPKEELESMRTDIAARAAKHRAFTAEILARLKKPA